MIQAGGGTVHWIDRPDGVRLRAAHWPGGARGTVLLLNGWKDFLEKYAEPIQHLRSRGFAVWSFEWRGQGLSTRLLPDRLRSHVPTFDAFLDDLDTILDQLVLPGLRRPLVLIGHSMGGHLAARALVRRPGPFDRAVLLAPMMDFVRGGPGPSTLAWALAEAMCRLGRAEQYGIGTPRAPMLGRRFEGNRLTSCPTRYAADDALIQSMPAVQLGGVTWGWLRAALASIALMRRPGFAEGIACPMLMLLAGHERVVDNAAARAFARRVPGCRLQELPGARHELLRERDTVRAAVWAAVDGFLDRPPA